MQVTANARWRKMVGSLARPNVEKRRSLNWDARSSKECISKKAALPVFPCAIASGAFVSCWNDPAIDLRSRQDCRGELSSPRPPSG